jgi:hypothetical protein
MFDEREQKTSLEMSGGKPYIKVVRRGSYDAE